MRLLSDIRQAPTVDEVDAKSLYHKVEYTCVTADGWELAITRYQPRPQAFEQPVLGEPLLLVHGFSQNRHAWTAGQFVKNLLYFGIDVHIAELRGHGKSSVQRQRDRSAREGTPLPPDLDYDWDLDSYLLYDLPAVIRAVERITGRSRIFYCGHSMGGILGYGYAGMHDDLEGLITIGAAGDLGSDFLPLRLVSYAEPVLTHGLDALLGIYNAQGAARHALAQRLGRGAAQPPHRISSKALPMDGLLRLFERGLSTPNGYRAYERLSRYLVLLSNPSRVTPDDIRWLLRHGGEKEPRNVLIEFARWIRRDEMRCYRTGYDYRKGFARIHIPMAIIFGDLDKLASVKSTRSVYRAAKSEYLLWRPVKGNSHLELTMGHDIRQICYDVKNLIGYAREHRNRAPSLPRTHR